MSGNSINLEVNFKTMLKLFYKFSNYLSSCFSIPLITVINTKLQPR